MLTTSVSYASQQRQKETPYMTENFVNFGCNCDFIHVNFVLCCLSLLPRRLQNSLRTKLLVQSFCAGLPPQSFLFKHHLRTNPGLSKSSLLFQQLPVFTSGFQRYQKPCDSPPPQKHSTPSNSHSQQCLLNRWFITSENFMLLFVPSSHLSVV